MKWYFCLNDAGLLGFAEIVLVAAHSALKNTDLEAHLIYDGLKNEITEYLSSIGVNIHYHRSGAAHLIDGAKVQFGYVPSVARGAYLRLDIPLIEHDDEYVIYTDCDVIFFSRPNIVDIKPDILAAAPEYAATTTMPTPYNKIFNSGVMLLNVERFGAERASLVEFARSNDFYFHGDGGFYDQGALNKFFSGRWAQLSQALNWRPFGGASMPPTILHFHGTKPYELAYILAGETRPERVRPIARQLFNLQPLAYLMACEAYLDHLPAEAERLVAAASPGTTGFVTLGRERAHEAIGRMRQDLAGRAAEGNFG